MEESISWLFDYVYYLCEGAIPIKTRNNPQRESLVFKMGPLIINDNNIPHPQNKNKKQNLFTPMWKVHCIIFCISVTIYNFFEKEIFKTMEVNLYTTWMYIFACLLFNKYYYVWKVLTKNNSFGTRSISVQLRPYWSRTPLLGIQRITVMSWKKDTPKVKHASKNLAGRASSVFS